jgi:hypothetical protein
MLLPTKSKEAFLKSRIVFAASLVLGVGSISAKAQSTRSIYTTLEARQCRTLKSDSSGAGQYLGRCPGVGGYSLLVAEDDLRQDITVVTPQGAKHSLNLWEVVSGAFSRVGSKAEWRMAKRNRKMVPIALIVRFIANEDSTQPNKTTSYLAVSKITTEEVCVTDKISSGANANEDARRVADVSGTKPCLKKP